MNLTRRGIVAGLVSLAPAAVLAAPKSDPEADRAAAAALNRLIAGNTAARLLNEKAAAVLVFPKIVKAGFLFGGGGAGVSDQKPLAWRIGHWVSLGCMSTIPRLMSRNRPNVNNDLLDASCARCGHVHLGEAHWTFRDATNRALMDDRWLATVAITPAMI